ncbi:protein of unknown function [Nitratireductor aquimarinus]
MFSNILPLPLKTFFSKYTIYTTQTGQNSKPVFFFINRIPPFFLVIQGISRNANDQTISQRSSTFQNIEMSDMEYVKRSKSDDCSHGSAPTKIKSSFCYKYVTKNATVDCYND